MHIDFLLDVFAANKNHDAIIWEGKSYNYQWLISRISEHQSSQALKSLPPGMVVAIIGDFTPNTIALFLALIEIECIVVPFTISSNMNRNTLFAIAGVEYAFELDRDDEVMTWSVSSKIQHEYYSLIKKRRRPGLVLFTSGTSGEPKAAVHDLSLMLKKFKTARSSLRTINFLLFDHWGGLNTMFHVLSNGGAVVTAKHRTSEAVCRLIEEHQIELLPSSPTFLNLMLLSGAYRDFDLSSLKIISYGTEPMPESTLIRLKYTFPGVKLIQTYGLIELGVMRSKSESDSSLWVKVGGDGYQTRVVDDMLQIKAASAMLGYLNADSPFTEDGWFITGDEVLQKGEYIKILGRKSEIINVGGEKVYPQEVENIIQGIENIADVIVYGERNRIMGNIVCANIKINDNADPKEMIRAVKKACREKLTAYKVPVKVVIVEDLLHNERFKKTRV
jgi:long-chain acyl-CoA synthetase